MIQELELPTSLASRALPILSRIYNIAQFANKNTVAEKFEIQSKNSLLPLEFYNTEKDTRRGWCPAPGRLRRP